MSLFGSWLVEQKELITSTPVWEYEPCVYVCIHYAKWEMLFSLQPSPWTVPLNFPSTPSGTRVGAWVEPGAELDPKTVYTTKSTSDCLYLKPVIPIWSQHMPLMLPMGQEKENVVDFLSTAPSPGTSIAHCKLPTSSYSKSRCNVTVLWQIDESKSLWPKTSLHL